MALLILKLITAHLIIHVLFQRDLWDAGKSPAKRAFVYPLTGAAEFAILAGALLFANYHLAPVAPASLLLLLACATAVRYIVDVVFARILQKGWLALLIAQCAHAVAIYLIVYGIIQKRFPLHILLYYLNSPKLYLLLITYVTSLGLGNLAVKLVTQALKLHRKESDSGLERAGRHIGVLERFLITSLMLFWPQLDATAVGLIFSAKSIARYPELSKKDDTRFAEYYLVGSLTSMAVAMMAGLVSRHYLLQ